MISVIAAAAARRNGGGFSPADLSDLVQWSADADLADGAVSTWSDLSGQGNHWVQVTGTQQPVRSSSGVLFDGVDDMMRCDDLASVFGGLDAQYTMFFVAAPTVLTGVRGLIGAGSSSANNPILNHRLNGGLWQWYRRGDAGGADADALRAIAGPETLTSHLYTAQHLARDTWFWRDGTLQRESPQDIGTLTVNRVALGALQRATAANFWQGYIREVLIYARALSFAERQQVEAYLAAKYSLTIASTANHSSTRIVDLFHSWWSVPHAVVVSGETIVTGITRQGVAGLGFLGANPRRIGLFDNGATASPDDHATPVIIAPSDKPPVVLWSAHNGTYLNRRLGTIVDDVASLAQLASTQKQGTAGTSLSYAQAFRRAGTDEGIVFSRCDSSTWTYYRTNDYFATLESRQTLLDYGDGNQGYMIARQLADGVTLRIAAYGHPTIGTLHDIYYCELDLASGDVKKADGTVLGNIASGENLPLAVTSLDLVYAVGGGEGSRLFDISDATTPEIAFATWTNDGNAIYRVTALADGAWTPRDIVATGAVFGYSPGTHYHGGMSFPVSSSGGLVYLSRESDGVWTIEKHVSADAGATWSPTILATAPSGHMDIRPYALRSDDPLPLLYIDCTIYGGDVSNAYTIYAGDQVGLTSIDP